MSNMWSSMEKKKIEPMTTTAATAVPQSEEKLNAVRSAEDIDEDDVGGGGDETNDDAADAAADAMSEYLDFEAYVQSVKRAEERKAKQRPVEQPKKENNDEGKIDDAKKTEEVITATTSASDASTTSVPPNVVKDSPNDKPVSVDLVDDEPPGEHDESIESFEAALNSARQMREHVMKLPDSERRDMAAKVAMQLFALMGGLEEDEE